MTATPQRRPANFTAADGVSLRDYVDTRVAALEKATCLAAETLQARLAGMNEIREALREQATKFVTREELGHQIDRLAAGIAELKTFRDHLEGKASQQSVMVALLLSVAGLVIGAIGMLTR